ncbi:MAG TPA: site-specific integrase [Nocardioides sp.]|nr:site-specific integrase [Nocardioides sp.]
MVTLAGSGLRIGELLGLQVSDVDFLRRTIRVERQRLQRGGIGPPKSTSSRRVLPVGQVAVDDLAAHLTAYPSDGALFVDEAGDPLTYRRWRSLWAAAATEAGGEFTSHGLKHFFASALIAGGASVKQVQAVLGHSSPVITLQTYRGLWPGDDDRTRDVMDGDLSGLCPPAADSPRTAEASDG